MQPLSTPNPTVHNLIHQPSSVHSMGSPQYSNSTEDSTTTYTNLNYDETGPGDTPGEPAGQRLYALPDNHSQGI